ncbi:glycosyltransferase family 2 protein [Rubritalea profundi]|uniref:Glycosyl transferase n=1 Tax=Rubritalea profundi TaxID=1658618 RepID=A0A2S7U0Q7_9BACT|nr:glycosyltransferase family 2 protein [Rubritalea profundi]PQJ28051.1 glycosyl transferase [Rubritalea profundi]
MKISIITAVYNREKTMGAACETMAAQDYADIEWVVVDGGSTDKTLEVLAAASRQPDILVSEPDKGIYDALNKGLGLATGEVIGLLHSDDFYPGEAVLSSVAKMFEDESVDAAYGDLEYVTASEDKGERGKEKERFRVVRHWSSGEYDRQNFKKGWMPPHPAFYMRRKYYEELGGFDIQYQIAADYDSMVRYLWKHELKAAYLPKVLMMMRTGGVSNRNLKSIIQKSKEDYSVMQKNGLGLTTLLWKNLSKIPQFFRR